MNSTQINELKKSIAELTEKEALLLFAQMFENKIVFSTSFGMEDQVITHFIGKEKIPIKIFTLDTGRMFNETYNTWQLTTEQYNLSIVPYYPNTEHIEKYVQHNGINAFYDSVELRKECCYIRKVEPLKRALKGMKIWVTGLRSEQSANRENMEQIEWDDNNKIIKFHPILHWKTQEVLSFLRKNGVPYNPLHDKGFISIGCAPCTRPIKEGDDFRAGRWWWEDKSKKECGLHA